MITPEIIQEVTRRLVGVYNPLEIYLFGSYAWGKPDDQSDLDLLIVVETTTENPYQRPLLAYDVLMDIDVSNDILVYTKEEFNKRAGDVTTLGYKIKHEGVRVLYARA